MRSQRDIKDIKIPNEAYKYAYQIGKPVPELENIIAESSYYSYAYVMDIIKDRFEKGERAIAQNSYFSYRYAKDIVKGRFEKGENMIAQNPEYSYYYARDVIKGRFEKGEDAIIKDNKLASDYAKKFGLKEKFEKEV